VILQRDQTFRVVFNLRTPVNSLSETVGTGIFIAKTETEIYLATATHVARGCNVNSVIVVSDSAGSATSLRLAELNGRLNWRHHPVADISVLPVRMTPENQQHLTNRFFPLDHFHVDKSAPSRDFELTSVGFPNGLGASGMFSPLTYRSYSSSSLITLNRADTNTPSIFFLLENPSMGGYSGCPVFDLAYMVVGGMITTKDRTRCYGIMHGTLSDATGGKLAAVTPAFYLMDLI
jgi:Trypsin-like peptidase domain